MVCTAPPGGPSPSQGPFVPRCVVVGAGATPRGTLTERTVLPRAPVSQPASCWEGCGGLRELWSGCRESLHWSICSHRTDEETRLRAIEGPRRSHSTADGRAGPALRTLTVGHSLGSVDLTRLSHHSPPTTEFVTVLLACGVVGALLYGPPRHQLPSQVTGSPEKVCLQAAQTPTPHPLNCLEEF